MKRYVSFFTIALAAVAALAFAPTAFAQSDDADDSNTYVPRAERDTEAVLTFVGSSKELKIVDHRTGETTYYSTRSQNNRIHRLSEEASARANERWEQRQAAAEEAAAAQAAEDAEDEEEAAEEATAEASEGDEG